MIYGRLMRGNLSRRCLIDRRVEFERAPLPGRVHWKISLHCLYLNFLGVPLNSRPRYASGDESENS